jgi:hypothetical protein
MPQKFPAWCQNSVRGVQNSVRGVQNSLRGVQNSLRGVQKIPCPRHGRRRRIERFQGIVAGQPGANAKISLLAGNLSARDHKPVRPIAAVDSPGAIPAVIRVTLAHSEAGLDVRDSERLLKSACQFGQNRPSNS